MYAYLFEDVKKLAISKVTEDPFGCKNVPAEGPWDIPSSVKVWIKGMSFKMR
jgi:hypothetical protein